MLIYNVTPQDDLQAVFDSTRPGAEIHLAAGVYRQKTILRTSGVTLVGARLGILDKSYAPVGASIFRSICSRYLRETDGKLNLGGICLVAGLGPENNRRRDGSYEYYISEPVVENDAKGLAPFLMTYTQLLQSEEEIVL